jgi:SP family general alpha glucoside:H+ symporter-like MFS transporter
VYFIFMFIIIGAITGPASRSSGAQWAQASLLMLWVFGFDITLGPMAYAIVGETPSTRLRAKTVGLARNAYNVLNIIAGILSTYMLNPTAWNWKGRAAFFWAGSAFLTLVWAYFRLPECRGRSYRQLDILFERRISARKFSETEVHEEDDS